ncbi:hypothetical protein L1987_14981 [Smallanthus sonchifolius]|uniref:Uncharacterized protein n=1 Tax=Smallanthus sonchifolius TaxID=185202 RepID=A0ACB9J4C2_9ASTR|nr:hypothetical protein L1987_14981 [Smallanthus sonchifolius]
MHLLALQHQSSSGGSVPGDVGSVVAEGMAFATGNVVAHRAMDAVMGPCTFRHETVAPAPDVAISSGYDACGIHSKAFQYCINNSGNDINKCLFYMDMLSACRRSSGLAA